jgi:hypothetical protein
MDISQIAAVIRAMPSHAASLRHVRESCARAFAAALKKQYAGFSPAAFLEACGVTP